MERVRKIYESVDAIVWFIVVFVIVALIFVPNFATESNITNIFSQACVLPVSYTHLPLPAGRCPDTQIPLQP